ncbi:hypothetical protein [Chryseobacterium sp. JUb7]|uniref:hypothetical protein n=1 Tax=Chryseobacterium sp. JUb7 TaxID=2940599 RepID=UPI002169C581|nr:hypothetical protein [Chryseobacterium sp. JUb7]MCS3531781.1 hypothetical protein [Chryseobacterium sp. JUb7]
MKNIFSLLLFAGLGTVASAQVLTNQPVNPTITNSNVLLDGSTNFSNDVGAQPYVGKGVIIPSVDLVNFQFDLTLADGATFPTMFDGMIVYNNATGTTLTAGNRSSTATAVTPGYYYFFNPNGYNNQTVQPGVWRPLGGDPRVNVATTETRTNTAINNAQVYAIKGTFTASGTSTAVNIPSPTGMTGMYSITIYKSGTNTVYDRSLYSYTLGTGAGNAITGSPSMSVVYPNGTYDYVLEYLK